MSEDFLALACWNNLVIYKKNKPVTLENNMKAPSGCWDLHHAFSYSTGSKVHETFKSILDHIRTG
jgi:hypothetical protein